MTAPSRAVTILLAAAWISAGALAAETAASDPPGFVQSLPDHIRWMPSPSIRPGGMGAVVYGDPRKPGPFITRVKLPDGYRIEPHAHPEERVYTVISGTFYIGFGDRFDAARLHAFPAGSAFVVPAHASHFHWMRSGESVVQVSGMGPTGIDYVDAADDPRKRK
jgi:quercetin dioxygenase-like cupin family protein